MREVAQQKAGVPAMTREAIDQVRAFEDRLLQQPQVAVEIQHALHAGVYSRTLMLPAGMVMTGAEIKIPTLLIVQGDTMVWLGSDAVRITGYAVLQAEAGRKQMFRTLADTHITMVFSTAAKTVAEAEAEFTDEADRLTTRRNLGD